MSESPCSISPTSGRDYSPEYEERDTLTYYSDDFESTVAVSPHKHWAASRKPSSLSYGANRRTVGRKRLGWRQRIANPYQRTSQKKRFCLKSTEESQMVSQILAAKQQKIDEIEDELFNIKQNFQFIKKENRTLKTLQQKQEKVIRKLDDKKSDLPRLISQHAEEQKALKFHLKKAQTSERNLETKIRDNNNTILKMGNSMERLKKLVNDNDLKRRSELTHELAEKERALAIAEARIGKLDKHIELNASSFLRQLNAEKQKHKEALSRLKENEKQFDAVQVRLEEKVRALDNANIYTLRGKSSIVKNNASATLRKRQIRYSTELDTRIPPAGSEKTGTTGQHDEDENVKSHGAKKNYCMDMTSEVRQDPQHERGGTEGRPRSGVKAASKTDFADEKLVSRRESPPSKNFVAVSAESRTSLLKEKWSSSKDSNISPPDSEKMLSKDQVRANSAEPGLRSIFLTAKFNADEKSGDYLLSQDIPKKNFDTSLFQPSRNLIHAKSNTSKSGGKNGTGEDLRFESNAEDKDIFQRLKESIPPCREQEMCSDTEEGKKPLWQEPEKYEVEKSPRKSYQFSKEVQNLHLGIPSSLQNCKNRLENLEKEDLQFGSYSPTVGGTPTRKNYFPLGEYKPASRPKESHQQYVTKPKGEELKIAKKSNLLVRLFGNLDIEKEKLLGGDEHLQSQAWKDSTSTNIYKISARPGRSMQCARKKSKNLHESIGDGDSLNVKAKSFSDDNNTLFIENDVKDRPA